MNYESQQILAAGERAGQYFLDEPLTPAIPVATALVTELGTMNAAMRTYGASQATGLTGIRSGSDERVHAFHVVLDDMRVLNRIAMGLDKSAHPGLRELFRMPRSRTFVKIAAQGRAFATNGAENEALFTDRGLPAGFLAAFDAKVTAAEAAVATRNTGLIDRRGATAGIKVKSRRIVAILKELDGIVNAALMGNKALLDAWQTARKIARRKGKAQEAPAAPTAPAGAGAPAPAGSGS